jgi:aryl-alcohol dehydrogenase-like predicted oxidoreductase
MTVPTVPLGSQGLRVSAQGLGCMGMSDAYGARDEQESVRTLHRALELGVSFLDTAEIYGRGANEELVGRFLAGRRDEVVLATKFGIVQYPSLPNDPAKRSYDGSPARVRASIEGSLRRLGTDHVDLYYQHRPDPATPIEDTVGAMAELVAEGKVRYLGLSEVDAGLLRRAHATHPISALQSEYSLWTRDAENVLPTLRELGVGLVAYSPLGRGFLTGQYRREDFGSDDFRSRNPRFAEEAFAANQAIVEVVREIAAAHDATAAHVALAWVRSRGEDVVSIPGTTKVARLEENAAALDLVLTREDLDRLEPLGAHVVGARY